MMTQSGSRRLTRRALLGAGGGLALLALAGCGAASQATAPAGTATVAGTAPTVVASVPTQAVTTRTASAASGAPAMVAASATVAAPVARSATAQTGGTRTVAHAMGETKVPLNPQRVVVLEEGPLNSALALGVTPVGAVTALAGTGYPEYLGEKAKGIKSVGLILEPNLEQVAALQPDLIISVKSRHEKIYPQLAQIAPTVFSETLRGRWQANFAKDAEALGKTTDADRLLADYQRRMDDFKAQMGPARLQETLVSVVRFVPGDTYLYTKGSYIGLVLIDAGLRRPPAQDINDFTVKLSEEQIQQIDGDVIFVTAYGPPDKTRQSNYQSNPLWQQLKAVQANKVYTVNDEYWMVGIGILAANRVADDLFKYFLNR